MTSIHTSLTSPDEIAHWLKSYNIPCSVSESIKIEPGKAYIFDRLYKIQSANGHWNFVYTTKNNEILIYDPFGIPFYTDEFKNKTVVFSLEQDQKLNEKSCGLYCFLFAFKFFTNILKLNNYLIVDFKKSKYYIKTDKNYNIDNYEKYESIYSELHNETLQLTKST